MKSLYDLYPLDDLYKNWIKYTISKTFGIPPDLVDDKMKSQPKSMTLYDILEVPTDANPNGIKASYRKLARKHHPDTGDGDTDAWLKIQKAYEVLADGERRKKYDVAQKVLAQKVMSPDGTGVHAPSYVGYAYGPNPPAGTPVYYSSGSMGTRQTRQPSTPTQPSIPFRIGQRIPQIGGVISQISVNSPQATYMIGGISHIGGRPYQYEVSVDATLHSHGLSANDLMSPDSWYDWLRLDKNKFAIVRIDSQFSTSTSFGRIPSLGATFVLDIREL